MSRRPEIQALRALAVALVVAFHMWPSVVRGGFVGVDVFFVVSGFLITSLLLREAEAAGRVSLVEFWARRARRILPAALVTLAFCLAATHALEPLNLWEQTFADIRASAQYVQNWHLAGSAVDYFAADQPPSPVQHFWSLSLEEQFYLVWPLLITPLLVVVHPRLGRIASTVALLALSGAGLALGIALTTANPRAAYYLTPARAWEFGLGALLALAPGDRLALTFRALLSFAGLAAIGAAALVYSPATPYPGVAAVLPTCGAAGVIAAGAPATRLAPTPLLRSRPVQLVGDCSYSIYLWHWPLLVLAPYALQRRLGTADHVVLLGVILATAAMSKRLVEDPVRTSVWLRQRPWRSLALAGIGSALMIVLAGVAVAGVQRSVRQAEAVTNRVVAAHLRCFGAAAHDPRRPCRNRRLRWMVVPTPVAARDRKNAPCTALHFRGRLEFCDFGVPAARSAATILVVGDSHAGHWRAALLLTARVKRWHGISLSWPNCPLSRATRAIPEPDHHECRQWKAQVFAWIRHHPEIHTVFVAEQASGAPVPAAPGRSELGTAVEGYAAAWRELPASVRRIVVIRDNPLQPRGIDSCITRAIARRRLADRACPILRRQALPPDPAAIAARRAHSARIRVVDLTRYFCGPRSCPPVIGGVLVHKDTSHLTAVFASTLGPYMLQAIDRALGDLGCGA